MFRSMILVCSVFLVACTGFEEASPAVASTTPQPPPEPAYPALVSDSGVLAINKFKVNRNTLIFTQPNNVVMVYDTTDPDNIVIVRGVGRVKPDPNGGWLIVLIPQDELIMDSSGAYSEVTKKDAIYKAVGINYSTGVMYPHAQVTFVRKDGTRRFDKGVISRYDPDDPD